MFEVKVYVTEIVPGNLYEVDIDGFTTTVADRRGVGCYVVIIYDYVW